MYTDSQDHITALPVELIKEVGSCPEKLEYSEVQTFRLVSKRINDAVEAQALSRLKLHWGFDDDGDINPIPLPLDKLQAYVAPGNTRAFYFVRHLIIGNVCFKLDTATSPLDLELIKETSQLAKTSLTEQRRATFRVLMENLLLGESLKNLKTIEWLKDGPQGPKPTHYIWPVDLHDQKCTGTLEIVAETLFQRKVRCQKFDIDISHIYLNILRRSLVSGVEVNKARGWPCQKLRIRSEIHHPPSIDMLMWLKQVSSSDYDLTELDTDILFVDKLLWALFGEDSGTQDVATTPKIQLRTLQIAYQGSMLGPQVLQHFRQLKKLVLWPQPYSNQLHQAVRDRTAKLWPQLTKEQIYIEDLKIGLPHLDHALLDYLDILPLQTLKNLALESTFVFSDHLYDFGTSAVNGEHRLYNSYDEGDLPERFFARVLPSIASGLEHLSINADHWYHFNWCIGTLPESRLAFKQCRALRSACVTLDCILTESDKALLNEVFDGCPLLFSVGTYDIQTGKKSGTISLCRGQDLQEDAEDLFGDDL